jgi:methyl-accepting chemotaxis protein
MRNFINHFFPQTVSGVMAQFQKTIDDLKLVATQQQAKADKHSSNIERLFDKVDEQSDLRDEALVEASSALDMAATVASTFGLSI